MFTNKNQSISSFEISELLFKAIIDFASVVQNPSALKTTAEEMRKSIALNDKERELRKEYEELAKTNLAKERELNILKSEFEDEKSRELLTISGEKENLQKRDKDFLEEKKIFSEKVQKHAEDKDAFAKEKTKLASETETLNKRQSQLESREKDLIQREEAVKLSEKKFKSAMAALGQ